MFSIFFFGNRSVYEINWENIIEPRRPQMTKWCMRIAHWIHEATNTQSDYFSTAAVVTRALLSITLYVLYIACLVSSGR